jgi:REP element-mobilizing transposase RayT
MNRIPLEQGKYYHIYNRGNNGDDLFYEKENYFHFLRLYKKYMEAVVETYAWVLLKNHFHLLVYIKEPNEIDSEKLSYSTVEKPKVISASRQFSHLFNAFTQSINKRHKRSGSLFEKDFERIEVTSDKYFQNLIYYIHYNPVKHGFVKSMIEYPWSSYGSIISTKPTKLLRKEVIEIFDDVDNFKYYHSRKQNLNNINDLLIE